MKQLLTLTILIIILASCGQKDNKNFDPKNYEQTKQTLAEKEKGNSLHFLSVTGSDKRRWLFGTTVYKGTIHNKATVVAYKNVRIKLLYFNSEGKQTANHEEEFEDVINPGDNFDFKAKYHTPKGTDSVAAFIMNAKVVGKE